MNELLSQIISITQHYGYVIVFIGTILAGDLVVIAAAFLASLNLLNIYVVMFLGLTGIMLSDSFWYFIGYKFGAVFNGAGHRLLPRWLSLIIGRLQERFSFRLPRLLLLSKLIYGTRMITLIFIGKEKMPYNKFFYYNFIGSVYWLMIMVIIGYLAGISWHYLENYKIYSRWAALSVLAVFLLGRLLSRKLLVAKIFN